MLDDALQYGALGVLALGLVGVLGLARAAMMPLLRDILSTNRALRELCDALRGSLAGQGQRLEAIQRIVTDMQPVGVSTQATVERLELQQRDMAVMLEELWREKFGSNRRTAPPVTAPTSIPPTKV